MAEIPPLYPHDAPVPPPVADSRPRPRVRRRLPPLFWLLLGMLALLLLLGFGSIGYYFYLTHEPAQDEGWNDVWSDLEPAAISPGLAVWTLTDIDLEQVYRQAMAGNELDTATAIALTATDLSESQRLGWLTVLARRHASAGDGAIAGHLLQLAADIAILEPRLADLQRANALLDAAAGWSEQGKEKAARDMLDQVTLIVQHSTELSRPVRSRILENIAAVYKSMGDINAASAVEALAIGDAGPRADRPVNPFDILAEPIPYPEDVGQFVQQRKVQAQAFVDSWIANNGQTSRGQARALENALIDEDLRRAAYYQQALSDEALPVKQRAAILWDQIQWLSIKLRVASGFYGLELVPNWQAERPAIRQALHDAFLSLEQTLTEYIGGLPEQDQPGARANLYRQLLIWARTGLYPDADQQALGAAMNEAIGQGEAAPGVVPIATVEEEGSVVIRLQTSER